MRRIIGGGIAGTMLFLGIGFAILCWNWDWPFYHDKTATAWTVVWLRFIVPYGALIGGAIGIHLNRRAREQASEALRKS